MKPLYNRLTISLIRGLTQTVPRSLHPPVAVVTAALFYAVLKGQRRGIRANLRVVTARDRVERLVFSTFYKYARNVTDSILVMHRPGPELQALIGSDSGTEHLDAALARGCGAIMVSPHLGSWELGGLKLAEGGYALNVLTYPEPDGHANLLREEVRRERGVRFIYVDRDSSSPLAVIEAVNALRRNEIVLIMGDRDGSSHSVQFQFFGRPVRMPVGAGFLATVTGAPVLPAFVVYERGRYRTVLEEPIYVEKARGTQRQALRGATEKILQVFERYISQYPDQWYNFYDYWGGARPAAGEPARRHADI